MEKLPECILFALFSGKIDCTFKTMVKVCGCCDKPYIWKQRKVGLLLMLYERYL